MPIDYSLELSSDGSANSVFDSETVESTGIDIVFSGWFHQNGVKDNQKGNLRISSFSWYQCTVIQDGSFCYCNCCHF